MPLLPHKPLTMPTRNLAPATGIFPRFCVALSMVTSVACGAGSGSAAPDATDPDTITNFSGDSNIVPKDVVAGVDAATDPKADADTFVPKATDVETVLAESATAVDLGGKTPLSVTVTRKSGDNGPIKATETVTFLLNGAQIAVGGTVAATGEQPAVSIWKTASPGQFLLVGVRAGKAELKVKVDDVAAPAITITANYAEEFAIRVATPSAAGNAAGDQKAYSDQTFSFEGKNFNAGSLDVTIRFPADATNGSFYDFGKATKTGAIDVKATIAGKQANPKVGRLWVDRTDKGQFRGTFLGSTADLTPVVGVFSIERKGDFGIDLLDDAVQIGKSSADTPVSNVHVSRASVSAIGNGKVLLTYRRVLNVTQAELAGIVIDAKTGEMTAVQDPDFVGVKDFETMLVSTLPPIAAKANAGTPEQPDPAIGYAGAARSEDRIVIAWEGKSGPDKFNVPAKPGIWLREMGNNNALIGQAINVSNDECNGQCRPIVLPLPSSRWIVLWSAPDQEGIHSRRYGGSEKEILPLEDAKTLISAPATGASAAVLDENLGLTWRDPKLGAAFQLFLSGPQSLASNGGDDTLGEPVNNGAAPAIATVTGAAPTFMAYFVIGLPPLKLQAQRVGLNGSKYSAATTLSEDVDFVVAVGGKDSHVLSLERITAAGTKLGPLRLRKLRIANAADPGSKLGESVILPTKSNTLVFPSVCYVPEANVFVAAWSGDTKSDGVWIQRFR